MEETAPLRTFNHNLVNALYTIKGIAESHLSHLQRLKDPKAEEGLPPIDQKEILDRTYGALARTLEQANKVIQMIQHFRAMAFATPEKIAPGEGSSFRDAVNDVVHAMSYEFPFCKVTILKVMPHTLPPIPVSREHLETILFQLIFNARQAIGDHIGIIKIEGAEKTLPRDFDWPRKIEISVSDTGPGIPESYLEHIFDPFFTTKDHKSGNGLGLYIVKRLVDINHGTIRISTNSKGTTFSLEFNLS